MESMPDWLLPNRVYDVMKWVGLVICPALATLILAVGDAWGLPDVQQIAATITAIGTFIGVVIGASALSANAGDADD